MCNEFYLWNFTYVNQQLGEFPCFVRLHVLLFVNYCNTKKCLYIASYSLTHWNCKTRNTVQFGTGENISALKVNWGPGAWCTNSSLFTYLLEMCSKAKGAF